MLKVLKPAKRSHSAPKAADWRRQRQVVKRILGKIGPLAPARMDCLHDVIDTVRVIANKTLREPSGKMKSQLKATATAFRKARAALVGLPDRLQYSALFKLAAPAQFLGDVDRIIDWLDQAERLDQARYIQCLDSRSLRSSESVSALVQAGKITLKACESFDHVADRGQM